MTSFQSYWLIPLCLLMGLYSCVERKVDCSVLKHCRLKFIETADTTAFMEIKNNKIIEFSNHKKYFIKSNVEWVSECEYNATMTEKKHPGFPLEVGTVMNVKIHKIESNYVYYTSKAKGKTIEGKLKLISR